MESVAIIRLFAAAVFFGIAVFTIVFWRGQNRFRARGGPIAASKLLWLGYALLLWYLLPPVFALDQRIDIALRQKYLVFFASMVIRGVIEMWMVYAAANW